MRKEEQKEYITWDLIQEMKTNIGKNWAFREQEMTGSYTQFTEMYIVSNHPQVSWQWTPVFQSVHSLKQYNF